jgi:hypothetical protein
VSRPALLHYQLARRGQADAELLAWLARALELWERTGLPLHRCLGLPASRRVPIALRDFWLCAAADIAGSATALYAAAVDFERRAWPIWQHLERPPSTASDLQGCLFYARRNAPFPGTRRQFASIARGGKQSKRNTSPELAVMREGASNSAQEVTPA